ncbi:uncharacterized protein [Argopecten irradians]|uniref:uncharacterized protein isoform X2 n=1 Tax=Argopecten irradians TaxID=31199 RepID=UPI003712640B
MSKLQDSYLLVERHLANAATHRDEARILYRDKEELEGKCEALKLALDSTHKDLDIQLSLHQQAVEQWNIKSKETAKEIEKLKGDLEMTSKNCEQLEELNSNWAKHNLELSTSLQEAKAILEVPKCDTETQTDVSLFEVNDVSCQTTINVASVPSQTDSPVTHPAYTQTYIPALANHQTQTVCTPRHVAATQTRVAAVANTGTMASTDMADRGVQTLPVRVFKDFNDTTSGCTKDTGPNRNENLSIERSMFTSTSDSSKVTDVNKCSDVDVQESCVDEKVDEIEDEGSQIILDANRHDTYTDAIETSTGNGCLTQIESITYSAQSGPDLNIICSHEVSTNSVVALRTSRTPGEENRKTHDDSQASAVTNRSRIMSSENDTQTAAAALNTVLNPPVADVVKEMGNDEVIVEFVSPAEQITNVAPQSESSSNAVGGKHEPRRSPNNSMLISSFRDFGNGNVEKETTETDSVSKVSPRTSGLSLSLRKPRLQSKKESTVSSDPVEEDSPNLMPSEEPSRKSTGKFKLNSEKPGSLFEGKALLEAYVAARSSSSGNSKQSPFQDITERRRTSSRCSLEGHKRNLSDSRETRYSYNVETKEMVMHSTERSGRADTKQTKSLGKQVGNNKETMNSRRSSDSRYASVIESSTRETKTEAERLSPFSRYSAMFRSRLSAMTSESQAKKVDSQNKQIDAGFSDLEPDKNRDSVRGILKGLPWRTIIVF